MKDWQGRALLLGIVLALLCGCSPVDENDLVGRWVVAASSYRLVPNAEALGTHLTLEADGTFVAHQVPGFLFGSTEPVSGTGDWFLADSGEGSEKWKKLYWEGHQTVRLSLDPLPAGAPEGPTTGYGSQVYVYGEPNGPTLYFDVGDPDGPNRVRMEKEPPSRGES